MKGFFITTVRGKEDKAKEELSGRLKDIFIQSNKVQKDDGYDIKKFIKDELLFYSKKLVFTVETYTCCMLISLKEDISCDILAVLEEKYKYISNLHYMEEIFLLNKNYIEVLKNNLLQVLKKTFDFNFKRSEIPFKINYNSRCSNANKNDVYSAVFDTLNEFCREKWDSENAFKVNLNNPDVIIMFQIIKKYCGFSVIFSKK